MIQRGVLCPALLALLCLTTGVHAGDPIFPPMFILGDTLDFPEGLQTGDQFGSAIATSDAYIAIGAPSVDIDGAINAGRVFVYDADSRALMHVLESSTPASNDLFGESIAISAGKLFVGCGNDDELMSDAGAVFVYDLQSGLLENKLVSSTPEEAERYGAEVALNEEYLFVGAINDSELANFGGSVSVYDATTLAYVTTLFPDDPQPSVSFGFALAASDTQLAVGAPRADRMGIDSGEVHLFDLSTMSQIATLIGSDSQTRDEFGDQVSINASRVFVGAELNDANGDRSGSVYAFSTDNYSELFKLELPEHDGNDRLGSSIDSDDEYVVVGSRRHDIDGNQSGGVFLFRSQDGRLLAHLSSGQLSASDQFGQAVAIRDERIFGGAFRQSETGSLGGAVYTFDLEGRVYENRMFEPCSYPPFDEYGRTIAIDGHTLVIGAYEDDSCGDFTSFASGTVYVYDLSTGEQQFQLSGLVNDTYTRFGIDLELTEEYIVVASNRGRLNSRNGAVYIFDRFSGALLRTIQPEHENDFDSFGTSIDIDQGLLVVGAPTYGGGVSEEGAAYVFDLETGQELAICIAEDHGRGDKLGTDVSIQSGVVAAGAPGADDVVVRQGAVYLFDAVSGVQLAKVTTGQNWSQLSGFGEEVVQKDDLIIVGAPDQDASAFDVGAVHVFDALSHSQIAEIASPWGASTDRFGHAITCQGDFMLVGMERRAFSENPRYPRALMYDLQTLEIVMEFVPSRGSELAGYGSGVALSSEYAIVGMSPERNVQSAGHTGAAFVYELGTQACPVDLNTDGELNFFDVSEFLVGYSSGDLAMDFSGDGDLNFFDVSAFIVAYTNGCP